MLGNVPSFLSHISLTGFSSSQYCVITAYVFCSEGRIQSLSRAGCVGWLSSCSQTQEHSFPLPLPLPSLFPTPSPNGKILVLGFRSTGGVSMASTTQRGCSPSGAFTDGVDLPFLMRQADLEPTVLELSVASAFPVSFCCALCCGISPRHPVDVTYT